MNTQFHAVSPEDSVFVLQLRAAGLISQRTAIEMLNVVEDVEEELRRIAAEGGLRG